MHVLRAFDGNEVAALLAEAVRSTGWGDAVINADLAVDRAVRDAEVLHEAANPALIGRCRERLFAATRGIASQLAPGTVLAEIQIVRYHPGGKYVEHRDTPALGATPRALSLVAYLNEDYTGGETAFADPDVRVAPLSGAVVVFSPVLLHRAEPVIAGTKYVITAWYHVPPA